MPNIRILSEAVLKISCKQGFGIAIMAESKKGHNFRLFCILMLHIKFQGSTQIGVQDIVGS